MFIFIYCKANFDKIDKFFLNLLTVLGKNKKLSKRSFFIMNEEQSEYKKGKEELMAITITNPLTLEEMEFTYPFTDLCKKEQPNSPSIRNMSQNNKNLKWTIH